MVPRRDRPRSLSAPSPARGHHDAMTADPNRTPAWTVTGTDARAEGGGPRAVRFDVRVPPGRRPALAAWAVAVCATNVLLVAMLACALAAFSGGLAYPGVPLLVGISGLGLVLLVPRVPGSVRLARWRLAGRESFEFADGRLRASRRPSGAPRDAVLDVSGGAFVSVVGDVDTFLVRATRWRAGRWFRRDDVPGLDLGSVRIATAEGAVLVGLSLSREEAESLAEAVASLPGFQRDRSSAPARPGSPAASA